jgi:hypothetical protein
MSTPYEPIVERIKFGRAIYKWFKHNRWGQDVPHRLAKITGTNGPWNSQLSGLMAGRLDPKPAFFVAFGDFNKTVAEQNLDGISERRLVDQLKGAQAFLMDDGRAATAPDFFSLFTGLVELPLAYAPDKEISDEEAKAHSEEQRKIFQRIAKDELLSPRAAWEQVKDHAQNMKPEQLSRFKEVLSDWGDWSGEELMAMATMESYSEPGLALQRWSNNKKQS